MPSERETLQNMLDLMEEDRNGPPALKGAIAFAVLQLVIKYLIVKVRE